MNGNAGAEAKEFETISDQQEKQTMKKYRIAAAALALGLVMGGCSKDDENAVAYLDGHAVSLEEYGQYAYDSISLVSAQYSRDYDADPNADDFWTTSYDGKTPMDALKEQADEKMLAQKGMQVIALDLDLVTEEEISWQGQLDAMERENEARLEKLESGGVVYGPEQLTQSQFLSYWQSALDQQVEDYFYQNAQPEEADLKDYYEQHREELDSRNFTAEVDFYYWPQEQSTTDAQSILAQILAQGAQGSEAAAELSQSTGLQASYRHEAINTRKMGKEDQAYTQVVELVRNAEDGQLAGCLYAEGMEVWVVPVSRQNESIGTFEEAEEEIEDLWRTEEAARLIDERLSDIEITTTDVYDRLTIDQLRP